MTRKPVNAQGAIDLTQEITTIYDAKDDFVVLEKPMRSHESWHAFSHSCNEKQHYLAHVTCWAGNEKNS